MFSVGGAITAPELHRAAMDQLMKQLVLGGMPSQVMFDYLIMTAESCYPKVGTVTRQIDYSHFKGNYWYYNL